MSVLYPASSSRPVVLGYKDPNAILDYAFLWQDWLEETETIVTATVTPTTGITLVSSEINGSPLTLETIVHKVGSVVTAWLSGGEAMQTYTVTNRIVTSAGRQDERSFLLKLRER